MPSRSPVSGLSIAVALLSFLVSAALPFTPPTCDDLAESDIFTLSYSGAHHYLQLPPSAPGLGALNYRQFSDWVYKQPLFTDTFTLHAPQGATISPVGYVWRPDYAIQTWTAAAGSTPIGEGSLQIGYLDAFNVRGVLSLVSTASTATTYSFVGALSAPAKSTVSSFSQPPFTAGAQVEINASLANNWGFAPSPLTLTVHMATDCPGARLASFGAAAYNITVTLPPAGAVQCSLFISLNDFATNATFVDTTNTINAWLAELSLPPPAVAEEAAVVRMYYQSWFNFWYNTEHAEGYWLSPVITPSKSTYGRGMWLWDSAFHIFALVHGGPSALALAENQVRVLANGASVSGHIPREVWAGAVSTDIQAPGILTWAALLIYQRTGNLTFIEEVYGFLGANNDWFYTTRDPDGDGLCEWDGQDSGWDTSPRWDKGIVEAVDLNAWLCLDQQKLADMAQLLGKPDEQARWLQKANTTATLVRQYLWDDSTGVFFDRLPRDKGNAFVKVITPATFWTMLAGIATPVQAARMVQLLTNKTQLDAPFPIPCVGLSEPTFTPTNYWRGPTWINLNYVTFHGLFQYGFTEMAVKLRQQTLDIVTKGDATPREYYNPLTGGGLGAYNYMWTGALLIATVNELP